jgi:hypothetical protein
MSRYIGGERKMTSENIDTGGTVYTVIIVVMTLVTLGLIFQVALQIFKAPDANLALRGSAICMYISIIAGAWIARSRGYKTVALGLALTPAVLSCLYNLFDIGVLQIQSPI